MEIGQHIGFDQVSLDSKVKMEETADDIIFRDVVIAREIVQPYKIQDKDVMMYKPANELEAAAWSGEDMWIMMDKHPDNVVIDNREDKHGKVRNLRFVKNLLDQKTKRPNQRGIIADLFFHKARISPARQDELKAIASKDARVVNRDVSIGFFYTPIVKSGSWGGAAYDVMQTNIDLNHLAAPIPEGRCPMPFCGIGADNVLVKLKGFDPEQTEDYIHIPVKDKGLFVKDSYRTKVLSESQGILAVMGKLKTAPDGSMVIQKYLFKKDKGWTMEKAKNWVEKHKDSDSMEIFTELQAEDFGGNFFKNLMDAVKLYKLATDMTLEDINKKIEELKTKRDELQQKISDWHKEHAPKPTPLPKELDDLYDQLDDTMLELKAYTEAKVMKIAGKGDQADDWVKFINWKQNRQAFDGLPENLQQLVREYGLCPDCPDADAEPEADYSKAPEDTAWNIKRSDYTPEQLSYACAVVVHGGTAHGFGWTGEGLTKGDCKLPHHLAGDGKSHGGTLVWRGVAAAGAALRGARGASITGAAASKAKGHLASHYKEFDKKPPWTAGDGDEWVDAEDYDPETMALVKAEADEIAKNKPANPEKQDRKIPDTKTLLSRPDLFDES